MQTTRVSDLIIKRLTEVIEQRGDPAENVLYDVAVQMGTNEGGPVASVGIFIAVECPEVNEGVYSTCHAMITLNRAMLSEESIDEALGRLWDHVETNRLAMLLGISPVESD